MGPLFFCAKKLSESIWERNARCLQGVRKACDKERVITGDSFLGFFRLRVS